MHPPNQYGQHAGVDCLYRQSQPDLGFAKHAGADLNLAPDIDKLCRQAWRHYEQGELDNASATAREAWQKAKHPLQMVSSCAALVWFLMEKGDLAGAEDLLTPTLASAPHEAVLHWRMGVLQHRKGNPGRAIHHLEYALAIDPALDEAATALAWLLHDHGKLADATLWVRHALAIHSTPERQAQLGWFLLLQGKPAEAIPLLQESLAAAPLVETTRVHLARALNEDGKPDQARQALHKGLEQFQNSPTLLLALGWLHRETHSFQEVKAIAEQVVALQTNWASAWLLLGLAEQALGKPDLAAAHFRNALDVDASHIEAANALARCLREERRFTEALVVISNALEHNADHPKLCEEQAQLALDVGDLTTARRRIHILLANDRRNGRLWYLLALTLRQRGRIAAARAAVNRALRHLPYSAEAWALAAWLHVDDGRLEDARKAIKQLRKRCPTLPDLDIKAAMILTACGDMAQAAMRAEAAVAQHPRSAEALHALGHVRHRQGHLQEAEHLTRRALACKPQFAAHHFQQLGWILRASGRLQEATEAFQQACEQEGNDHTCLCDCAETLALAGEINKGLETLERARAIQPEQPRVQLLHAKLLCDLGPAHWEQAITICVDLLRKRALVNKAAAVLLALAAKGHTKARQALDLLPQGERLKLYQDCLDSSQARGAQAEFLALTRLGLSDFPDDGFLQTAALCAKGIEGTPAASDLARHARAWGRRSVLQAGTYPGTKHRTDRRATGHIRIAYVAAHFHRSLLVSVLAAHDFDAVDVFLYCDVEPESLGGLAERIVLEALEGQDLAASMEANQIDVAIDTVGVTPFLGQAEVLRQFARRVAPVQCAWLGTWGSGGGVFDYLISDTHAVPDASHTLYEEDVCNLPGGQWCWQPPVYSPPLAPPPHIQSGRITLGCAVRAFRVSRRAIQVWVDLLKRLPLSQLVFMGEHGQSVQFAAEMQTALAVAGLSGDRVSYRPRRAYQDYLAEYRTIDIALDCFPANGGLCLLDALWMGVPVVTLAGQWAGERQGASILGAIGRMEWVAADEEAYIHSVCALAFDPGTLTSLRKGLRNEMAASSLFNGRRVAQAIEAASQQWVQDAQAIVDAATPKERVREVAQRQLNTMLKTDRRLDLRPVSLVQSQTPDLTVVVVLFNQAGLSRQALSALADQTGVCFETILVDNASGQEISQLLACVKGARLVQNTSNIGFLHAANQGAAMASGRHILFLNSDAIVQADALRIAVSRLDSDKSIGAVGGRIVLADGLLQEAGCIAYAGGSTTGYGRGQDPFLPEFNFVRDVDFCSGAFLMVRRHVWTTLGGFDPTFAPAYYEDSDLCLRMQDLGLRVVYDPGVWILHFEWGSAASSQEAIAMMEKNGQHFYARHQKRLGRRPHPTQASPHRDRWQVSPKTRILIIDNGVPHAAAGGGLPRARLMVQALSGSDLTLFPMWDIDDDWRDVYTSVPETVEVMLGIGARGLENFLQQRMGVYDYVMVSRPPNMACVNAIKARRPDLFGGMQIVYDAEALFALREIGKASLSNNPMTAEDAQALLRDEITLAQQADQVICVSEGEAQIIRSAGVSNIHLLTHAMETRANTPDWSNRENLLFVGALHPGTPNEDSLLWFCREVMPILRDKWALDLCINIVGDCTSGPITRLANNHIRLLGRVEDLRPCYDLHRVFVAPTRFAAGVPAKVIEAACNGIPVVATPLLVGQLGWEPSLDILAADGAQNFAGAIAALYTDPDQWNQLRTAAQDRTRVQYSPSQFQEKLRSVFALTKRS